MSMVICGNIYNVVVVFHGYILLLSRLQLGPGARLMEK